MNKTKLIIKLTAVASVLGMALGGDEDARTHREELACCDEHIERLLDSENEITRAFRRGDLSAEAWRAQLKEIADERRTLKRSRDVAQQQVAAAEAIAHSIDAVEIQIDDLRDRIRTASLEDRKAIIDTVVPGEQPFGIVLWPDGKIEVRGALPVLPEPPVVNPYTLPAQTL